MNTSPSKFAVQHIRLAQKAETLETLANDFNGLIRSRQFTEALGLIRVMARLRIETESLIEQFAYADNVGKESRS